MFFKNKKAEDYSNFISDVRAVIQLYAGNIIEDFRREVSEQTRILIKEIDWLKLQLQKEEAPKGSFILKFKDRTSEEVKAAYFSPEAHWVKFYSEDDELLAVYDAEVVDRIFLKEQKDD